jgi:hypothetical protein
MNRNIRQIIIRLIKALYLPDFIITSSLLPAGFGISHPRLKAGKHYRKFTFDYFAGTDNAVKKELSVDK